MIAIAVFVILQLSSTEITSDGIYLTRWQFIKAVGGISTTAFLTGLYSRKEMSVSR